MKRVWIYAKESEPVVCDVAIHFSGFIVRISEAKRSDAHNVWVYDYMRMFVRVLVCVCVCDFVVGWSGLMLLFSRILPDMGIEFSASLESALWTNKWTDETTINIRTLDVQNDETM